MPKTELTPQEPNQRRIDQSQRIIKRNGGKCPICKTSITGYARDVYGSRGLKDLTCNDCWGVLITLDSNPDAINRCINYHYGRPLNYENFNRDCTPALQIYDGQI